MTLIVPSRHFRLRSALDVVAQGDDFAVVGQRAAVFFDLAVPGADLLARVEQEGFTLYGDVVPALRRSCGRSFRLV